MPAPCSSASIRRKGAPFRARIRQWARWLTRYARSCGDYASGTNHTLPTYGYARMYSGVNTATFLKHITSQLVTARGLDNIGDAVVTLARAEGLEGHANSVAMRLADIRAANKA